MKKKLLFVTAVFAVLFFVLHRLAVWRQETEADSLIFYVILFYGNGLMSSFNLTLVRNPALKVPKLIHGSFRDTGMAVFAYALLITVTTFPVWANFFSLAALFLWLLIGMICFDAVSMLLGLPETDTWFWWPLKKAKQYFLHKRRQQI